MVLFFSRLKNKKKNKNKKQLNFVKNRKNPKAFPCFIHYALMIAVNLGIVHSRVFTGEISF